MAKATYLDTIPIPRLLGFSAYTQKTIPHFLEDYKQHPNFPKSKFAPLNFL